MIPLFPIKVTTPPILPKNIYSGIQATLSSFWKNTGVKVGVGLGATAGGLWALTGASQEATKGFGEFGGISGSILLVVIIGFILLLVVRKK